MPNASLERWLHPGDDKTRNLTLATRLSVAVDVVLALEYLHHHCETPIAHCDLKPSNVLLDEDMTACVADFGLARFLGMNLSNPTYGQTNSIALKGSIGYVAPEYGMGGPTSTWEDIYSFGVLLLEMLTGKRPTDEMFKDDRTLQDLCKSAVPDGVMEIMDSSMLREEVNPTIEDVGGESKSYRRGKIKEYLISLMRIGVLCSSEAPSERMEIKDTVTEMNIITEVFHDTGIHGKHMAGEATSLC